MALDDSSFEVDSSNRRSKTCCVVISVSLPLVWGPTSRLTVSTVEYVTCKTCKSPDTLLVKENRIFFVACESCGSRRSVNAIKTGFQAQVGRRSKNKTG